MNNQTAVSTSQPELDAQLAFENRLEAERHITKVIVRVRQPTAQDLQIEARGRSLTHIDVWPTGAATALISVEEQLSLPNQAHVRIAAPLSDAYDVTVYTSEPDSVQLTVTLV